MYMLLKGTVKLFTDGKYVSAIRIYERLVRLPAKMTASNDRPRPD